MSLIKCPECGKEIKYDLETCSNCGYPIENNDLYSEEANNKTILEINLDFESIKDFFKANTLILSTAATFIISYLSYNDKDYILITTIIFIAILSITKFKPKKIYDKFDTNIFRYHNLIQKKHLRSNVVFAIFCLLVVLSVSDTGEDARIALWTLFIISTLIVQSKIWKMHRQVLKIKDDRLYKREVAILNLIFMQQEEPELFLVFFEALANLQNGTIKYEHVITLQELYPDNPKVVEHSIAEPINDLSKKYQIDDPELLFEKGYIQIGGYYNHADYEVWKKEDFKDFVDNNTSEIINLLLDRNEIRSEKAVDYLGLKRGWKDQYFKQNEVNDVFKSLENGSDAKKPYPLDALDVYRIDDFDFQGFIDNSSSITENSHQQDDSNKFLKAAGYGIAACVAYGFASSIKKNLDKINDIPIRKTNKFD